MNYIVKERFGGRWIDTFFKTEAPAGKLCNKIIEAGGRAVWMRSVV